MMIILAEMLVTFFSNGNNEINICNLLYSLTQSQKPIGLSLYMYGANVETRDGDTLCVSRP